MFIEQAHGRWDVCARYCVVSVTLAILRMIRMNETVFCVCDDDALLRTRCAVLVHHGYKTGSALASDAAQPLAYGDYDLVVFCSTLAQWHRAHLTTCVPQGKPLLQLHGFVHPSELLVKVAEIFAQARY